MPTSRAAGSLCAKPVSAWGVVDEGSCPCGWLSTYSEGGLSLLTVQVLCRGRRAVSHGSCWDIFAAYRMGRTWVQ